MSPFLIESGNSGLIRLNFAEEITRNERLPDKVIVNEITLREEPALDVILTHNDRMTLVRTLDKLGVHQIQTCAEPAGALKPLVQDSKREDIRAKIAVLVRPYSPYGEVEKIYDTAQQEMDAAIDSGADIIQISHTPREGVTMPGFRGAGIDGAVETVEYLKKRGAPFIAYNFPSVTLGPDLEFLKKACIAVVGAGAQRVSFNDSAGAMKPSTMKYLVGEMRKLVPSSVQLEVHCHNDSGLAVANTLAACEAGASVLDTAMNGVSDAACVGMASLDEVVMALKHLYGRDIGIKTEYLYEAARVFERITGRAMGELKPIVSDRAFSGRRNHSLRARIRADGTLMEEGGHILSASEVGNKFRLILGAHSGSIGVKAKAKQMGISVPEEKVPLIVRKVNEIGDQKRAPLTDEEFRQIVESAR